MRCVLGCTLCGGVVQAVQEEIEERLMSLREDMQAAQQHITQQFAQHQVQLPCIQHCTVLAMLLSQILWLLFLQSK